MKFELNLAVELLSRCPKVLINQLKGLPEEYVKMNEGGDSWSPFDIVGHFIHGEKTDWIPRARIILKQADNITFEPFDRFAQFDNSAGKSMSELLTEFSELRKENLAELNKMKISGEMWNLKGIHPNLGQVTLQNLIATWVTHDFVHIAQINRVLAKLNKTEVGPWEAYIPLLNR